jgi:hypothetical protein
MSSIKSPRLIKKKKPVRNIFDIVQFKKMIGKGLVTNWSGVVVDKKSAAEDSKKIKDKLLSGNVKTVGLTGYINNGVIYIFVGIEKLYGINSISYSEIKKAQVDIEIYVNQYSKLSKEEILTIIG